MIDSFLLLTGAGVFSTGKDSPVNADWFMKRSFAVITRASAGVMSPAERKVMSPGTMSWSLISFFVLSRRTVAVVVTFSLRASAAFSALFSW